MIPRALSGTLEAVSRQYPVVAVTGPRQSGKTTLVRSQFPDHTYITLEDPDTRAFARSDPRRFLALHEAGAVFDEVQQVPELLSYLQGMIDDEPAPGRFILAGSSNLLLLDSIGQTLAGRVGLLTLLPFSLGELQRAGAAPTSLDDLLHRGLYPPIYDRGLEAARWYAGYVATFVERDVRRILNVNDLERFQLFLRLCAGRSGQLLNLSALGNDCGVTHNTARSWLSVLETLYVVYRVPPHHLNFRKRLVKTPKLYFVDPGLLTYLLEIDSPRALATHAARGAVFETWVVSELLKARLNRGLPPRLHFWRDHMGHEVDVLVGRGDLPVPVEIKAGATVVPDYFKGLDFWNRLSGADPERGWVVYGGEDDQPRARGRVIGWNRIQALLDRSI